VYPLLEDKRSIAVSTMSHKIPAQNIFLQILEDITEMKQTTGNPIQSNLALQKLQKTS
jgi:hypothetical protein